jgi:hypothetical protein
MGERFSISFNLQRFALGCSYWMAICSLLLPRQRRLNLAVGLWSLKITGTNGFCGHSLKPPIEEAINRLCNQFA